MTKIIKRDGRKEAFNRAKVINAIEKAFISVDGEVSDYVNVRASEIADYIEDKICQDNTLNNVEKIQDMVEERLMASKRKDVAREYVLYRKERSRYREFNTTLMKNINIKVKGEDNQCQNANVDELSFGGRKGEADSVLMKEVALNMTSPKTRYNHLHNRSYIHDLDNYAIGCHNCLSIPFDDLLSKGFNTRQTDVRPANSINTACQLVAVIFQLQSLQQFGGVSATHLDWSLVPFVRKSFFKHYIVAYIKTKPEFVNFDLEDMLFDTYMDKAGIERNKFDEWLEEKKEECLKELGLTKEDFTFDNKDKLVPVLYQSAYYDTVVETKQAVEGMYHNLNTLQSRSGNQLPFTSINYGTCTLPEGRLVLKALLNGSIKGVGKYHKTPIFPCGIFTWDKDINGYEGTPNYDLFKLALKSTAKRLYPNYSNNMWSTNLEWVKYDRKCKIEVLSKLEKEIPNFYNKLKVLIKSDPELYHNRLLLGVSDKDEVFVYNDLLPIELMSEMGCRTINGADIWAKDSFEKNIRSLLESGTFYDDVVSAAQKDGRGNIAPATVIMPTLAMEAGRDVEKFMSLLDTVIEETKDGLLDRYHHICSQSVNAAKFMYGNHTMVGYVPEEGIESALRHGTLAIGQIGLAETLQLLIGCDQTEDRGMELAKRIEQLFKDRCAEYKEKYKLNFGVYCTPAENLCFTAMKKFQKDYGVIENVSDKEYFTNSIHVPVWKQMSPIDKINIESQLTGYSSAGCITYVELDGAVSNNLKALETIVTYAMEKDIPYFAVNIPVDFCEDCGYSGEIGDTNPCPQCGSHNVTFLRRVTGYLSSSYLNFNTGKRREVEDRYKHSKKLPNWHK